MSESERIYSFPVYDRRTVNQWVAGSSPAGGAIYYAAHGRAVTSSSPFCWSKCRSRAIS